MSDDVELREPQDPGIDLREVWSHIPWLRAWPHRPWRLTDPVVVFHAGVRVFQPGDLVFRYGETWIHANMVVVGRVAGLDGTGSMHPEVVRHVLEGFFDVVVLRDAARQARYWKEQAQRTHDELVVMQQQLGEMKSGSVQDEAERIPRLESLLRDKERECEDLRERIQAVVGTMPSLRRRGMHLVTGEQRSLGSGSIGARGGREPCDGGAGRCTHLRDDGLVASCIKEPALLSPGELAVGPTWCPGKDVGRGVEAG